MKFCECHAETDLESCIDQNHSDQGLDGCAESAAICNIDAAEDYQSCLSAAWYDFGLCVSSCLASDVEGCNNQLQADYDVCGDTHVTGEFERDIGRCGEGVALSCESGDGGETDPPPGDTCYDQAFKNNFMERNFDVFYYAGSGGARECVDGEVCFREQFVFYADGTYSHVHSNLGEDVDSELHNICVNGEWSVSCDRITLSDCRRTESYALRVEADTFWIGAKHFDEGKVYVHPVRECSSTPCR